MGIDYLSIVTCDRCGKASRYADWDTERSLLAEWATFYPATVTPVRCRPPRSSGLVICLDCVTKEEKGQLESVGTALQAEEARYW